MNIRLEASNEAPKVRWGVMMTSTARWLKVVSSLQILRALHLLWCLVQQSLRAPTLKSDLPGYKFQSHHLPGV